MSCANPSSCRHSPFRHIERSARTECQSAEAYLFSAGRECDSPPRRHETDPTREWSGLMNAKIASVEPLLPVELGPGKIKFAQGMKAGRWVFANGLMGQDFVNGVDPEVLSERMPHGGLPKREKEAARLFKNLDAVLK